MARKIIGGKYIVETENAYFHYEYLGVEDTKTGLSRVAHLPRQVARIIYESIKTMDDVKRFITGKIYWDVRDNALGSSLYKRRADIVKLPRKVYVVFYKGRKGKAATEFAYGRAVSTKKSEVEKDLGKYAKEYTIKSIQSFNVSAFK